MDIRLVITILLASCRGLVSAQRSPPGSSPGGIAPEIVGGTAVGVGELPYQVSLQDGNGNAYCGGSILNTTHILTAAHCVHGYTTNGDQVVMGMISVSASGTTRAFSEVKVHDGYSPYTLDNDIAVIKLASPLTFNDLVNKVTLPATDCGFLETGTSCLVSGWGTTKFRGPVSDVLLKVSVPVYNRNKCNRKYKRKGYGKNTITNTMLCAGGVKGKDSCQGDSGGPLVQEGTSIQVGIVSWGHKCATRLPGVYQRTCPHLAWLKG